MSKIQWGILGTGKIAQKFAASLQAVPGAELRAVGSRTRESSEKFGAMFQVPNLHSSYESLASDPAVDVIYVATPHPMHAENSLMCLQAGKAVLCEKPFTVNAKEAERVIQEARARGLFLMEAMWTRFFPLMRQVVEWVQEGTLGDIRMVSADFGFRATFNPDGRLFNPRLGGGALLDIGIYPVSFAHLILGKPDRIMSAAHLGATGIDENNAILFHYPQGELAMLSSSLQVYTPHEASIIGTKGRLTIRDPWWQPKHLTLWLEEKEPQDYEFPKENNGMNYEATEVVRCLKEGKQESDIMTLQESLEIMRTLDEIRSQWGLVYPSEK